MITILAVGGSESDLANAFARHPSVEIVTAREVEDALDKLARNRRVDAVLLLDGAAAASSARIILEEDPAAPPLYAPAAAGSIPGVRLLAGATSGDLVAALAARLEDDETR
ncbi:MAG TPA: hypothetical protein VKG23_11285 [Thermoanaerobaculia bacterium]|nr:hypothetical protein [Thermoanaerobaculia bacterium]